MDRTLRCELLGQLPDHDLDRLATLAGTPPAGATELVIPPTVGMVMARVREGVRGETFNLGEVLVTECQVRVGAADGWAMLAGARPAAALRAATIDAVLAGGAPAAEVDREIARLADELATATALARTRLDATRVRFEVQ